MNRFDYITTVALNEDECKNRVEVMWYHNWNPHGVAAVWGRVADQVSAAVEAKRCKSGAYLVHSHGNTHHVDALMELVRKGRRATKWEITYHVKQLREQTDKAREFLASLD